MKQNLTVVQQDVTWHEKWAQRRYKGERYYRLRERSNMIQHPNYN